MQEDFHYYATYCAANLAGYSHQECLMIAYASQLTDCCSETFLRKLKGPKSAATTQTNLELADTRTDVFGLQNITRIWASFHFLPCDLYARLPWHSRPYMSKYRLICGPDSELVEETVRLAKGKGIPHAGMAMHVLADTWAHRYYAGTPSLVINNADGFRELEEGRSIKFRHNPSAPDDLEKGLYSNTLYQWEENSPMNLGHGRAGHLPDYSFMRYAFLPSWNEYNEIVKDNPADYYRAFCQMIHALKYLKGTVDSFERGVYDEEAVSPHHDRIMMILEKRQRLSSEDWREFGEELSGERIEAFDISKYVGEYLDTVKEFKDDTFLGRFFIAAMSQKSMVTNKIFKSGNLTAGFSVDFNGGVFKGLADYGKLVEIYLKGQEK